MTAQEFHMFHNWHQLLELHDWVRAPSVTPLGERNSPLELRNSPGRDPGVARLGKSSRSDMTARAPRVTWLGKSSKSDMTGQELQK